MRGERRSDSWAVAVNEIEDAGWDVSFVENLREEISRERCEFAGFEHHRATRRDRRRDFCDNLVHRPVPWRDQATDTDRFFAEQCCAANLFKGEVLEKTEDFHEVRESGADLRGFREGQWCSHL